MPIAIVMSPPGIVPGLFYEETAEALLLRLRTLVFAPDLPDQDLARVWLQTLPEPSGWFNTMEEARAAVQRLSALTPMTADEVRAARDRLGMTREVFATAIGYNGNKNTRHNHIFDIERGKRQLNAAAIRKIKALLAEREIDTQPFTITRVPTLLN